MRTNPHPARFIPKLNAEIDTEVWTLVKAINGFGFVTISSCQGEPGFIGKEGFYGHVVFMDKEHPFEYENLAKFTFRFLRSFFSSMHDDVMLEISLSEQNGFMGWLRFRNEVLADITRRLYAYREVEGK